MVQEFNFANTDTNKAEQEQQVTERIAYLEAANRQQEELLQCEQQARVQVEKAKAQLEIFYAEIVRNMQLGLIVWHLEDLNDITSFQLVAINPAATRLTGVSLEDNLGRQIIECFPNILKENRGDLERYALVAISGRGIDQSEVYYGDQSIPGSFFSVKVFPLPNHCIGIAFDNITQRKQAEQALRESEARFHAMAENAPVMIWLSGLDRLCTYFNKNWLEFTGRTLEQELGYGWTEGVLPEDLEHCLDTYITAFDARQAFVMEYRLRRFDSKYSWILDKGTPRFNSDGSFAGYIGSCLDISDRKQTELTLKQRADELTRVNTMLAQTTGVLKIRNDELDQFAYVVSHDLKAPLRAIASLSEWMEEDLKDQLPEENQHQMRLLRGRVHRMEALINGLLEYSRVGRTQTPSLKVNVNALLMEVIDSLAPPETFSIEVESGMPTVISKRVPLQQVFTNLIGNAIKHHTRRDGHVKISVKDQGQYYEFAVSDDGPGIAPEYHEKVFVIFQTLEARDQKESTGVGLAIVKKIVETEAGKMTLESQVGFGSTFRFTWPKQPQE